MHHPGKARARLVASLVAMAFLTVACGPSPEAVEKASFTLEETDVAVSLFSTACLETLPSFDRFEQVMAAQGLTLTANEDGKKLYKTEGAKPILALHGTEGPAIACGVGFLGPDDFAAVGQKFLTKAERQTGGAAKERFPSSYFQFAVQLRNGSVMSHEASRKGIQIHHIFFISTPVPRSEVAAYIYN